MYLFDEIIKYKLNPCVVLHKLDGKIIVLTYADILKRSLDIKRILISCNSPGKIGIFADHLLEIPLILG